MREIALHILDLLENSIRAQATKIVVGVTVDPDSDRLEVSVEDNGTGLKTPVEQVASPFYTTKEGKRTGLGLSLLRAAAEQADGELTLGESDLGGTRVWVEMGLSHVDRTPLGDLAGTLSAMVLTNPDVDFQLRLVIGGRVCRIHAEALAVESKRQGRGAIAMAQRVAEMIKLELDRIQALAGVAL